MSSPLSNLAPNSTSPNSSLPSSVSPNSSLPSSVSPNSSLPSSTSPNSSASNSSSNSAAGGRAPVVLMFRPSPVAADTRAKKIALSLARGGYEVILLDSQPVPWGTTEQVVRPGTLGVVQVRPVLVDDLSVQARRLRALALRTRTPMLTGFRTDVHYRTARRRRQIGIVRASTRASQALLMLAGTRGVRRRVGKAGLVALRGEVVLRHVEMRLLGKRQLVQIRFGRAWRELWRRYDVARLARTTLATERGMLPELADYTLAFDRLIVELRPDIVHAHHPTVLPIAARAVTRLKAVGLATKLVYDAREDFAGIPSGEQGTARRHSVLVRQEAQAIAAADAVFTVSEPIADVLAQRYNLALRPTVVLNMTVDRGPVTPRPQGPGTVRQAAGLGSEVPLLVYSGGMSRARGIEDLIDAVGLLPEFHLALVTVPHPHPMTAALMARAELGGWADRIHVLPPVGQDDLLSYLSGADLGVHPVPSGAPNHDAALPNKLFEYVHAGLGLVVSDAKLMAEFVSTNHLGEVFATHNPADLALAVRRAWAARQAGSGPDRDELRRRWSWQEQEHLLWQRYATLATPAVVVAPGWEFPSLDVVREPDLVPDLVSPDGVAPESS